jgi:hypothetical protein
LQLIAAKYPHDRDSSIEAHARELSMSKSVISRVVFAGLLATAIMPGTNDPARAAAACLPGPDRAPAPGGHWYYHLDHVSNRKCWYLLEPASQTPGQTQMPEAPESQPAAAAAPQSPFGAFFSSLSTGLTGPTAATQPEGTGQARIPSVPADDLKNDQGAPGRQPRMVHSPDAEAAVTANPHRSAHARPHPEHAEDQAAQPLDQAERDALFQEFLRWRDRRPAQP